MSISQPRHVLDGEQGDRDAVAYERFHERLDSRMGVGLEHELRAARIAGRHEGQPSASPSGISVFLVKPNIAFDVIVRSGIIAVVLVGVTRSCEAVR